jgi:hypothetical protein
MDDSLFMRHLQALCSLSGDIERFLQRQRARPRLVLDALALHELHRNKGVRIELANFVYSADVGMVKCRRRLCFPYETSPFFFTGEFVDRREFQRDRAAKLRVFGLIDDTHSAFAVFFNDAVMGNGLADHNSLQPEQIVPPNGSSLIPQIGHAIVKCGWGIKAPRSEKRGCSAIPSA